MSSIEYGKGKPRWSAPSPEEVDPKAIYTLTINPAKQFFGFTGLARWQRVYQEMKEMICYFPRSICDIYITLEISCNGRIHGHGTIKINEIVSFYTNVVNKWQDQCSYEIDTMPDPDVWQEYCTKGKHLYGALNTVMTNNMSYREVVKARELLGAPPLELTLRKPPKQIIDLSHNGNVQSGTLTVPDLSD